MFVSMILDIQRIPLISRLSRIWKSCFRNHDVWKILWYLKRSFACNMIEYNMAKVMFSYLMRICKRLETLVVLIHQKVLESNIILAIHRYKLKVAWSWINPWWGWIFDVGKMFTTPRRLLNKGIWKNTKHLMMVIYFKVQVQRHWYLIIHALDYVSYVWLHYWCW